MFERTRSGQRNRARFLGYDFICYVEGDDGDDISPDITFWGMLLGKLRPDLRIKCVPRGGKPVLEALAKDVVGKDISNVLVAMDADYDQLTSDLIIDRRVLYTYGYSWENDAFDRSHLGGVYKAICHCGLLPEAVAAYIATQTDKIFRELRWPSQADHIALQVGTSVFPRRSPGRVVKVSSGTAAPYIDRKEVLRLVKEAKARIKTKKAAFRVSDVPRYCVGHVLELAMIYIIKAVAKLYGRRSSLSSDHIRDICLQTFSAALEGATTAVSNHHRQQCVAI